MNTRNGSAVVDFMAGTFLTDDGSARESFPLDRDETYRRQHQAILAGQAGDACFYSEGCAVVRLIEAIEHAAERCAWVTPE